MVKCWTWIVFVDVKVNGLFDVILEIENQFVLFSILISDCKVKSYNLDKYLQSG